MAHKQTVDRKETLIGHTDAGRVIWPTIRSSIRRNDPDGMTAFPYYPSLTGTSLSIVLAGDFTGLLVANFISDSYGAAILVINALSPANLRADDDNGYLRITNLNPGKKNLIIVASGTAAPILGFEIDPIPGSASYAGELPTTATGWPQQNNDQLSRLVSSNESLNSIGINRAVASIANMFDSIVGNMDREFAIPRKIDVTVTGGVFTLPGGEDLSRIFIGNTTVANPTLDALDKIVSFVDTNDDQVFVNNTRVRVQSMTYGALVDATTSFAAWNTSDGKSIFGNLVHWNKTKTTGTISKIKGNVLTLTGGSLLVTRRVLPGDTLLISGATNNTPFSHNGEFIVEAVHGENHVSVRPKGLNDQIYDTLNEPPASLNLNKQGGEVFGTITVVVGKAIPSSMPGARVNFNLNVAPPNGTYRAIVSVARSLRTMAPEDLNLSTVYSQFGKQIELGSKLLGSTTDAQKPRIIAPVSPNDLLTLFAEFPSAGAGSFPIRIYINVSGGFTIVSNAKYDSGAGGFSKDTINEPATYITIDNEGFYVGSRKAADNAVWLIWDSVATIPFNNADLASLARFYVGTRLGDSLLGTAALARIPRLTIPKPASLDTFIEHDALLDGGGSIVGGYRTYYHSDGLVRTLNASWDGTNWVKDTANAIAFREQISKGRYRQSIHSANAANFSNNNWIPVEEVREHQYYEEFGVAASVNDDRTGLVTPIFNITAQSNTKSGVVNNTDNYTYGTFVVRCKANGNFSLDAQSPFQFPINGADFALKFRLKTPLRTKFGARNDQDNPGFFFGFRKFDAGMPTSQLPLGIAFGTGSVNWFYRNPSGMTGFNDVDTTVENNEGWIDVTLEKCGGEHAFYINGVKLALTGFDPTNLSDLWLHISGSASADEELLYIDYAKVWFPRPLSTY